MDSYNFEIAVYGGAFNPPHAGHCSVISQLCEHARRVLIVPSFKHAFGKDMAAFESRAQWLEDIARAYRYEGFAVEVDRCEEDLSARKSGPVYTWDLLNYITARDNVAPSRIAFVAGEDNVINLPSFYRSQDLMERFGLIIMKETIALHSTEIRTRMKQGQQIDLQWVAKGLTSAAYEVYR